MRVINMTNAEMSAATKARFAAALKEKMEKKALSKISISELTQAANVNRKTFYYYFEDINALLKWMFEEEAFEIVRRFENGTNYAEAMNFIMDYVEQNDHIIKCAGDWLGTDGLKSFFYQDALSITKAVLANTEKERNIRIDSKYRDFLTLFLTDAITGMLLDWAGDMRPIDRDKTFFYLTHTYNSLINNAIYEAVRE